MAREGYAGSTDWGQFMYGLSTMTKQELADYIVELGGMRLNVKTMSRERVISIICRLVADQYDDNGNKKS